MRLMEAEFVWVRPRGFVGRSTPVLRDGPHRPQRRGGIANVRPRSGARERDETEIHEEMVVWTRA